MKIVTVTSLYRSAPYIEEFHERIMASAANLGAESKVVFVNDGSPDNALEVALNLARRDSRVTVVDLSRNFGHHKAMMTGIRLAAEGDADYTFIIDVDLEERPELLTEFMAVLRNNPDADSVYGVQENRSGGMLRSLPGELFYKVFNWLSGVTIPQNLCMARLMTRRYTRALAAHAERNVFLAGLFELAGFKQISRTIEKPYKGSTTYTLKRRISSAVEGLTSFSSRPLKLIAMLGLLVTLSSLFFAGYFLVRKIFFGITVSGWTSLIVSIWILGGLTLLSLGVISVYISKMFLEIKDRPFTVIRATHNFPDAPRGGTSKEAKQ